MAFEFEDVPNKVIVNPRDTNKVIVEEQVNRVEIAIGGPQGIPGPAGAAGATGPAGAAGATGAQGPKGTYTVSETAPSNPQVGDTWFNSTTSQMYIRYDGYWVETSSSYLGPSTTLNIGTVTTGNPGSAAAATITGNAPSQTLNLTIPTGATGTTGAQGIKGDAGSSGVVTVTAPITNTGNSTSATIGIDLANIPANIVPSITNTYTLGSPTKRWADIYIGPGTINITDSVTGNNAGITVANGIFQINGVVQAQLPNVKVTNLTFNDNTIQTTAYVPGTVAIRTPAIGNTLTVNLATDTYVHQHINSGNLSITLTNPTAGRTVEVLLMWGNASGGSISINGISGSNISNGSNGFAITKQFNSIRLYCIDNNFTETFAVVSTV